MLGTSLSTGFASLFSSLNHLFRRWIALYGQQSALSHDPEVEAYTMLAQVRRRHAAATSRSRAVVIRLPSCIDDAQLNLRITI